MFIYTHFLSFFLPHIRFSSGRLFSWHIIFLQWPKCLFNDCSSATIFENIDHFPYTFLLIVRDTKIFYVFYMIYPYILKYIYRFQNNRNQLIKLCRFSLTLALFHSQEVRCENLCVLMESKSIRFFFCLNRDSSLYFYNSVLFLLIYFLIYELPNEMGQ